MSLLIRKINFKNNRSGKYAKRQAIRVWPEAYNFMGVNEGRCHIVIDKETGRKCLQVNYAKRKVGPQEGGAQWKMKLGKSFKDIYFEYKVKFPRSFNFVLGGKLPGVGGGTLPAGGKPVDDKGFTVRIMWCGEDQGKRGRIVQYVYSLDKDLKEKWGEDMRWRNNHGDFYFTPGKWQTLKTRVKMNKSGKQNGIIKSWLDGKIALTKNVKFRNKNNLGTDTFIFTTFFGGNTIEWSPKKQESVLFDEFKIYTKQA